jgi:hypothetical protein
MVMDPEGRYFYFVNNLDIVNENDPEGELFRYIDTHLLKFDSLNSTVLWTTIWRNDYCDTVGYQLLMDNFNGDIFIAGASTCPQLDTIPSHGNFDMYLLQAHPNGAKGFVVLEGENLDEIGYALTMTEDGQRIIVAGTLLEPHPIDVGQSISKPFYCKYKLTGARDGACVHFGSINGESATAVVAHFGRNQIVVGGSVWSSSNVDAHLEWVVSSWSMDTNTLQWRYNFGSAKSDRLRRLVLLEDRMLVLGTLGGTSVYPPVLDNSTESGASMLLTMNYSTGAPIKYIAWPMNFEADDFASDVSYLSDLDEYFVLESVSRFRYDKVKALQVRRIFASNWTLDQIDVVGEGIHGILAASVASQRMFFASVVEGLIPVLWKSNWSKFGSYQYIHDVSVFDVSDI